MNLSKLSDKDLETLHARIEAEMREREFEKEYNLYEQQMMQAYEDRYELVD